MILIKKPSECRLSHRSVREIWNIAGSNAVIQVGIAHMPGQAAGKRTHENQTEISLVFWKPQPNGLG